MNAFLQQNKEILSVSFSLLAVLLTFFFKGILDWRHKICFDYSSKREVSVSILRDTFIHEAGAHHEEVGNLVLSGAGEAVEIYRRPENQQIISHLAFSLERSNKIKRYYQYLETGSKYAIRAVWVSIVLSACPIANIWLRVPVSIVWIWVLCLLIALLTLIIAVSTLVYFDGKFFHIVNNIIKPEVD
jgi:hypothetical protein